MRSGKIFCEIRLEGSRGSGGAEEAWVAGCPLKVPKGQFPVKYTRTVPRPGARAVSGRGIDIKADGVYARRNIEISCAENIFCAGKADNAFYRQFMPDKNSIGSAGPGSVAGRLY